MQRCVIDRSVSFALATSSLAFAFLTLLYVCVDVFGWWDGTPFIYPGKLLASWRVGRK